MCSIIRSIQEVSTDSLWTCLSEVSEPIRSQFYVMMWKGAGMHGGEM